MDGRPAYVTPMKAVLTAERPAGPEWVFERKLDGIRCLAVKALTSILEPVMIVLVGGIVGFIVIAMYMPMFKVYDSIQ